MNIAAICSTCYIDVLLEQHDDYHLLCNDLL